MRPSRVIVVFNRIPQIAPHVDRELAAEVEKAAKAIEENVHRKMEEPKTGRTYIIGGKLHQASAEGEAPAILSKDLYNSIVAQKVRELEWIVPAEGIQAWWEFGLRGYAARPYFRPAVAEEQPNFAPGVRAAIVRGTLG